MTAKFVCNSPVFILMFDCVSCYALLIFLTLNVINDRSVISINKQSSALSADVCKTLTKLAMNENRKAKKEKKERKLQQGPSWETRM